MPEIEPEDDGTMDAEEEAQAARLTEAELPIIDECILSNISHHWRKTAKVVALTMGDINDNFRLPDVFYSGRIKHLAAVGLIEAACNLNRMRHSEVRHTGDAPAK